MPTMNPATSVLAVLVEAGHLRRLASEQRAAVLPAGLSEAFDDLHGHIRIEAAGCKVVEEEERLGALDEDVVHTVIHEIDADRAMRPGHEGDTQLGPDAVGARDEHGIGRSRSIQMEQPAERADIRQNTPGERATGERADTPDDFVAGVYVDAGGFVVHS